MPSLIKKRESSDEEVDEDCQPAGCRVKNKGSKSFGPVNGGASCSYTSNSNVSVVYKRKADDDSNDSSSKRQACSRVK